MKIRTNWGTYGMNIHRQRNKWAKPMAHLETTVTDFPSINIFVLTFIFTMVVLMIIAVV